MRPILPIVIDGGTIYRDAGTLFISGDEIGIYVHDNGV